MILICEPPECKVTIFILIIWCYQMLFLRIKICCWQLFIPFWSARTSFLANKALTYPLFPKLLSLELPLLLPPYCLILFFSEQRHVYLGTIRIQYNFLPILTHRFRGWLQGRLFIHFSLSLSSRLLLWINRYWLLYLMLLDNSIFLLRFIDEPIFINLSLILYQSLIKGDNTLGCWVLSLLSLLLLPLGRGNWWQSKRFINLLNN